MDYIAGLTLAGGDHDGEPFDVLRWERRFLRGAFRQAGDAALSVARGNGKSALVAGIAAAVVDPEGPLTGRRREVVCCAASFEQSRVIFEDVLAFVGERYDLGDRARWRKQDSANRAQLQYKPTEARVRCIGSDPNNAHGLRPALVLADEPAQWPPATAGRMVAALRTGLGKVPGSKLIALGTRPADELHWFAPAAGVRPLRAGSRRPARRSPVPAEDLEAGQPESGPPAQPARADPHRDRRRQARPRRAGQLQGPEAEPGDGRHRPVGACSTPSAGPRPRAWARPSPRAATSSASTWAHRPPCRPARPTGARGGSTRSQCSPSCQDCPSVAWRTAWAGCTGAWRSARSC